MTKIINIDETSRIEIIPDNYVLQYKVKTKKGGFKWKFDGYFPDLVSLSYEYINCSPHATSEATEDIKKLIKVIKTAESNIDKVVREFLENNK